MKILRLLAMFLLIGIIPAMAIENERTVENAITNDSLGNSYSTMSAGSTNTTLTKSISLNNTGLATNIGVMYKATSSGTVAVSLQALRSFQRPTTEQSTDATYVSWNAAATTNDQAWHMVTLDTVVEPYLVYKITGTGANDATTTMQIKVEKL